MNPQIEATIARAVIATGLLATSKNRAAELLLMSLIGLATSPQLVSLQATAVVHDNQLLVIQNAAQQSKGEEVKDTRLPEEMTTNPDPQRER